MISIYLHNDTVNSTAKYTTLQLFCCGSKITADLSVCVEAACVCADLHRNGGE